MDIKELNKLSVSNLKRLLKSRAGRIAELEVEIKIISTIIDQKIKSGDITTTKKQKRAEKPTEVSNSDFGKWDKAIKEIPMKPKSKIKTASSDHAFEEID